MFFTNKKNLYKILKVNSKSLNLKSNQLSKRYTFIMLLSNYNYLFLDFETTGLDPKKDEPIQI